MKQALSELEYPLRVNVNYLVEGEIAAYVTHINVLADRERGNEIRFPPRGDAIPHITMIMGEVRTSDELRALGIRLAKICPELQPISYGLTMPYFPTHKQDYLFVDVTPRQRFQEQKHAIGSAAAGLLNMNRYGSAQNVAHITLAYLTGAQREHVLREAQLYDRPEHGHADRLHLSLTGRYGTCIETIAAYDVG